MKVRVPAPPPRPSRVLSSFSPELWVGGGRRTPQDCPGGPRGPVEAAAPLPGSLTAPGDRRISAPGLGASPARRSRASTRHAARQTPPLRPPHARGRVPRRPRLRTGPGGLTERGAWGPAGGAHATPRLPGPSRPRAVLRGLIPGPPPRPPKARGRGPAASAGPAAALAGPAGPARHPQSSPAARSPSRAGERPSAPAGAAAAPEAAARQAPPRGPRHLHGRPRPPRRPAAELSPPLCSGSSTAAAAAPGPPLRCRLLPAARRLSGLSRRRARGAGGTLRPPPPPPCRPPPSSPAPPARTPPPAPREGLRARGAPCL